MVVSLKIPLSHGTGESRGVVSPDTNHFCSAWDSKLLACSRNARDVLLRLDHHLLHPSSSK